MLLSNNLIIISSGNSVKTLSLVTSFVERVEIDNGVVESERCLNNLLKRYL